MSTIPKYAAAWIGLAILAIVNETLREKVYGPSMTELSAHQISTVIGLFLFGAYLRILTGIFRIESASQAVEIGCRGLATTVVFEFVFGYYVVGHPWERLLHDYNVFEGRIWVLVPIWTAVASYVFLSDSGLSTECRERLDVFTALEFKG